MRRVSPDPRGVALLRALVAAAAAPRLEPLAAAGPAHARPGGPGADRLLAMVTAGFRDGSRGGSATVGGSPATEGGADDERIAALVTLAQRGDAEAFGRIYDRYVDSVYRYLYYRVGSAPLAEDLTSETFLRALRRIDSFQWQGKDIGAWFVTIARNLVADHFKSSRFRLEVTTGDILDADRPDRDRTPEDTTLDHLRDTALLEAVQKLKAEQQECIVLRFLQGLSVAETARVLGRSEGAVKQLQLRAVRALAALVPEYAP